MTAGDTAQREPAAPQSAMPKKCLSRVFRAARGIATVRPQERGDEQLVGAQSEAKKFGDEAIHERSSATDPKAGASSAATSRAVRSGLPRRAMTM